MHFSSVIVNASKAYFNLVLTRILLARHIRVTNLWDERALKTVCSANDSCNDSRSYISEKYNFEYKEMN